MAEAVGRVAKEKGFEVISLDLKNADINLDILEWDNKVYPSGYFDFVLCGCRWQDIHSTSNTTHKLKSFFFLTRKGNGLPSCASAASLCNSEAKNQRSLRG